MPGTVGTCKKIASTHTSVMHNMDMGFNLWKLPYLTFRWKATANSSRFCNGKILKIYNWNQQISMLFSAETIIINIWIYYFVIICNVKLRNSYRLHKKHILKNSTGRKFQLNIILYHLVQLKQCLIGFYAIWFSFMNCQLLNFWFHHISKWTSQIVMKLCL